MSLSAAARPTPSRHRWWALAAALALTVTGCQAPEDDQAAEGASQEQSASAPAGGGQEGDTDAEDAEGSGGSEDAEGPDGSDDSDDSDGSEDAEGSEDSEGGADESTNEEKWREASEKGVAPIPREPMPENPEVPNEESWRTVPSNVPMKKLEEGEKPPQFVLVSFDGGGWHDRWQTFMETAQEHDARFTVFLTGIYLAEKANSEIYQGPKQEPGSAAVSFYPDEESIAQLVDDLNQANSRGHEIGTHYNGHFCASSKNGADTWSTEDWQSELDQFFDFITNYRENNGYGADFPTLEVQPDSIRGGRLPCLDGKWSDLVPAWKEHGITYDTSRSSTLGTGVHWPYSQDGLWQFEVPVVYSPAFDGPESPAKEGDDSPIVTAMDYNFWAKINGAKNEPEKRDVMHDAALETYRYMYASAYAGNRAPLVLGNHFNGWNDNAFNPAVEQFMSEVCGEPDTYCTTHRDVIQWLSLQDPERVKQWQSAEASAKGDDLEDITW